MTRYKVAIDADIAKYAEYLRESTLEQYGVNARTEIDSFLSILDRGGKRIRGALTMVGYEMSGGTDAKMIVQAARAIEMLHAYLLIVDDIQDRSDMRRGGPSAHRILSNYHHQNDLAGDGDHFGVSIALAGALAGAHAAEAILANLEADPQLKLNVLSITNRTLTITNHGQTNDIMNEAMTNVSREDIERVLAWKTAGYTFLNPLHVGMVLAGADCHATDAITDYAMHTGKAFQLTDDLLGTFGNEFKSGKAPQDDMREGKRTLLVFHALEHAGTSDKAFLLRTLGNKDITHAQFEYCKEILTKSGARDFVQAEAEQHIKLALESLDKAGGRWGESHVQFLRELAQYLPIRTT